MIKDVLASKSQAETIDQPRRRFFGSKPWSMSTVWA